jgi:hypothetical protein
MGRARGQWVALLTAVHRNAAILFLAGLVIEGVMPVRNRDGHKGFDVGEALICRLLAIFFHEFHHAAQTGCWRSLWQDGNAGNSGGRQFGCLGTGTCFWWRYMTRTMVPQTQFAEFRSCSTTTVP